MKIFNKFMKIFNKLLYGIILSWTFIFIIIILIGCVPFLLLLLTEDDVKNQYKDNLEMFSKIIKR